MSRILEFVEGTNETVVQNGDCLDEITDALKHFANNQPKTEWMAPRMLTTIDYGRMTAVSKSAFAALFDLLHGQELTIEQITTIASHAADTVELGLAPRGISPRPGSNARSATEWPCPSRSLATIPPVAACRLSPQNPPRFSERDLTMTEKTYNGRTNYETWNVAGSATRKAARTTGRSRPRKPIELPRQRQTGPASKPPLWFSHTSLKTRSKRETPCPMPAFIPTC